MVWVDSTNQPACSRRMRPAASAASAAVAKMPKQVAPEPDMRANRAPAWVSVACAVPISGARARAGVSRSLRVVASQPVTATASANRGGVGSGGFSRLARRENTAGVETQTPGLTRTIGSAGKCNSEAMS